MLGPMEFGMTGVTTTGRYLALLPEDDHQAGVAALQKHTGVQIASARELSPEQVATEKGVVFEKLGVAVVEAPPEAVRAVSVATTPGHPADVLALEPERLVYALEAGPFGTPAAFAPAADGAGNGLTREYLRGFRDAVVQLAAAGGVGGEAAAGVAAEALDESELTWGLQATGVARSRLGGAGIKVAVLDTGFDATHPDFLGRTVVSESFVAGEPVRDVVGHGTHCIGTACGPREPGVLPRYGIAFAADIHVGKVLNDQGRGVDGDILAGIEWAMSNGCAVISMSLGAPVQPGQAFSRVFERAARRALRDGTLIVAAAGNDSRRDLGRVNPVSHPANCPSILAVAALDPTLRVSFFSNGGTPARGGQVDIAAPGRDVRSSWPTPQRYKTISGTSMATPHVAGIVALAAEAAGDNRGEALWLLLQCSARRLPQASTDVGAGLVQAP